MMRSNGSRGFIFSIVFALTGLAGMALDSACFGQDPKSGSNKPGRKIGVVSVDGAALERDLQNAAGTTGAPKPAAAAPAAAANCFANDTGPFKPTIESLKQYQYPEWFRDAKLGFWAHWGPQAVPRQGDWYARAMYESGGQIDPKTGKVKETSGQYRYHVAHYGHPSVFGYKDIIPLWKAEKWNPDQLMALYKKAGAKYFVSMGSHHDNFFLWDSKFHRWNAVKMGPHRDMVGDWQKAAQKAGLRFGVSEHIARNSHWYGPSHGSDASGPKAGVPYDGNDPANQDLYGPAPIPGDDGWTTSDPAGQQHWAQALQEIIDFYHPDLIYSDSDLPFGNNRELGRRMLAHYYNQDLLKNGGNLQAVYTAKTESPGIFVRDIERGVDDRIANYPWQTDTSIGDWYYRTGQKYKSAGEVIQMLADIVSKNGNLLLNIVQTPEGDLEPDAIRIVNEIGAWTSVNGECIYGTRPWTKYGEGPSAEAVAGKSAMYNEGNTKYTAKDIRFTRSKDDKILYALALGWPSDGKLTVKSLASAAGKIKTVSLLGHDGKLDWAQTADGLVVRLPAQKPCEYVFALKVSGDRLQPAPIFRAAADASPAPKLVIVQAVYGVLPDGDKADVTAKVAGLVKDDALAVEANNDTFGDPAEGHDKKLQVDYVLDGVKKTRAVEENETLTISAASRTQTGQPAGASPDLLAELKKYPHKILIETRRDGNGEIYRINADGSNPVNLTNTPDVDELYPKASPDGSMICFLADEGAKEKRSRNLYVMNADGGARRKIADNAADPCWSTDGKQIAFPRGEFERYGLMDFETRGIFIYDLASGQTRQHPNRKIKHLYCLNWSADGKWFVAVIHGGMGFAHNIIALEAEGRGVYNLHCDGCRPDLSFDDKRITWNDNDSCLGVADLDLGASPPDTANRRHAIESDGPAEAYHSDWSPDTRYIAFSRGVKLETKNLHGQMPVLAGAEAPGWNTCVADARATNRWVQITFDGESNKEPDWQFVKVAGEK